MRPTCTMILSGILSTAMVFGQNAGSFQGEASFGVPRFASPAVVGAPYSGEQVSERVQTLGDGTHITQKNPGNRIYRDSQGRTRTERTLFRGPVTVPGPAPNESPLVIEIVDPVEGFQYTLDTDKKVAHRAKLLEPGARPQPIAQAGRAVAPEVRNAAGVTVSGGFAVTAPPRPDTSSESLGTKVIDGVVADGRRTTMTYPVGIQGNDRPIIVTSESWFSKELGLTILSTNNDPRSGVNTNRLENLSRAEPDPNLFRVPVDYTIVDETGSFTIKYSRP